MAYNKFSAGFFKRGGLAYFFRINHLSTEFRCTYSKIIIFTSAKEYFCTHNFSIIIYCKDIMKSALVSAGVAFKYLLQDHTLFFFTDYFIIFNTALPLLYVSMTVLVFICFKKFIEFFILPFKIFAPQYSKNLGFYLIKQLCISNRNIA